MATALTRNVGSVYSIIVHSLFFVGIFSLRIFGVSFEGVLLILTTLVSLEAIYLSIFIQMTVNRQAERITEVSEDIGEIQEDVEDIQEDVKEISDDVEDIQEDVKETLEAQENIALEIEKDESNGRDEKLQKIEENLQRLIAEIEAIRKAE
jgi:uncharacterized protein YoxC